jgi:dynein light chain LC8-type
LSRRAAEDLSEEDEAEIKQWCEDVFKSSPTAPFVYSAIAEELRQRCDKEKGRGWNCVVGRSFGAFVTQKLKAYVYLSVYPGVSILLWKA